MNRLLMPFITLFIINTSVFAQDIPQKAADCLINCLNNHSVMVQINYMEEVGMDSLAKFLVKNASDYIIVRLIEKLADTNMTVACHIMLTKIFEITPHKFQTDDVSNSSQYAYEYKFNNFSWREIVYKNSYEKVKIEFDKSQILELSKYWSQFRRKRLIVK